MTVNINPVGTCDFELPSGEDDPVEFCGKPAVCELWFERDCIPEARYCKGHRPTIKELC